jgi:flagellar hook-associated protein 3 FlgL
LATGANNGTRSANDVQAAAQEIAGIRDEVMTLANTSYQGQYIFAGTNTVVAPFSTSTSTSPATTSYAGDSNLTYLRLPNGQQIQLNVPGNQIFQGPGAKDVFAALNNLIADYSSGTVDQAQAAIDTQALTTALSHISQQRVMIDNSITSLAAASEAVTNEKTQLTVAQTNLMQADVAQVATSLSLAETQQTALQAVIVHLSAVSNSLFSKL